MLTSSTAAALRGLADQAIYRASQEAVKYFARNLPSGFIFKLMRVNGIAP